MKAILLNQAGGPEQLVLGEAAAPQPKNNEVLVRLKSAGLNHVDIWVRQGNPAYKVSFPHIMGSDGAGVVEAVGPEAEGISVGDRVVLFPGLSCGDCFFCKSGRENQCDSFEILGTKKKGTYAEFVTVPDQNVMPLPDDISFETAAAYPVAYVTAWHMLINRAKLSAGETLLVPGASAGVSVAAIQIAVWKKARVLALTTNPDKAEKIKALGAEEVLVIKEKEDFSPWCQRLTGGRGVDVVLEHVGPATWDGSLKSLSKYGRLVTCGATTGPLINLDLRFLFSRDLSLLGARLGTHKDFREVSDVIFSGSIKPLIDRVFPLADVQSAHHYMDAKKQVGKILLKI